MGINSYLKNFSSKENMKKHIIEEWNWENPDISETFFEFPKEIKNNIEEATEIAKRLNFKIFLFNLKDIDNVERKMKSFERKILNSLKSQINIEDNIFTFSFKNFDYIDFVRAKTGKKVQIKRFSITPENRNKLRTASEQLSKLKLDPIKISSSYIRENIEAAFSVEEVTEKFYEEYINIFNKIKKYLLKYNEIDVEDKQKKLDAYIHQILNRIMFLYFVQKRGCFGGDKNFLSNFWNSYKNLYNGKNKFHNEWINVLFFESLCQQSWLYKDKDYLGNFNKILKEAPYLNGGLFEKKDLDKIEWIISDEYFDEIFEFYESYNFTVEESTTFDLDIAINPEMLGNIYEHMVNIEEKEEQSKAGIFYTERIEIEFMLGRAITEFLFKKTKINKDKIYKFIFQELEDEIENPFNKEEAEKILDELNDIIILDPACGSGHYLVVTAQILYKLKSVLWDFLKKEHSNIYEEKKKIIERNIYGNDIKEWAVNVAKLRLWLDLFVDADLEILKSQIEPLLPNLNFKIRFGDSLVQRIGNELIPLRKIASIIKERSNDLKNLIQRKKFVYNSGNFYDFQRVINLEKNLLLSAIRDKKISIQKEIQKQKTTLLNQENLFELKKIAKQQKLFEEDIKKRINDLENSLKGLERVQEELSKLKEPPMLWDLAYAEVFAMKNGFDIVIANPPYVRQEKISDLNGFYTNKEYKEKLADQLKKDFLYNYEGKVIKQAEKIINIDKKSDLYVYFYLKGLKLLNSEGVLCYISSNSWLDVGYGKEMQKILLNNFPIIAIYDNRIKRSFKRADINTIIALIGAMDDKNDLNKNIVSFVMFKKPFENVMFSDIFIDLEKRENFKKYQEGERRENEYFRIHIIGQNALIEIGKNNKTGEYEGNKWGGKYLRAPDIYWKILEKGKNKLVRLGDIAKIFPGCYSGIDDFFYFIREPKFLNVVEKEFKQKIIVSPKQIKNILIKNDQIDSYIFYCPKSIGELQVNGREALEYIKWGEKQKTRRHMKTKAGIPFPEVESVKKRIKGWWAIPDNKMVKSSNFLPLTINDRFYSPYAEEPIISDRCFHRIIVENKDFIGAALSLNSSLTQLFIEIIGTTGLGKGALDFGTDDCKQ